MSVKRTSTPSATPGKPARGRADFARLAKLTEREIRRTSPPELADLPASFWKDAVVVAPIP